MTDLNRPVNVPDWMPHCRCHKQVWAMKISQVIRHAHPDPDYDDAKFEASPEFQGGSLFFNVPGKDMAQVIQVDADWYRKHKPDPGGYYVVYEDGYASYSPAAPFESGYDPLPLASLTYKELAARRLGVDWKARLGVDWERAELASGGRPPTADRYDVEVVRDALAAAFPAAKVSSVMDDLASGKAGFLVIDPSLVDVGHDQRQRRAWDAIALATVPLSAVHRVLVMTDDEYAMADKTSDLLLKQALDLKAD